ncbi:hypothetical protein ACQKML_23945 [Peribacillus frigoritolerans]
MTNKNININASLNKYNLFQWVCNYNECLKYKEELEASKTNKSDEFDPILLGEIDKAIDSFKDIKKDFKILKDNTSVFTIEENEYISFVIFRSSPISYSIRAVVKNQKCWEPLINKVKGISLSKDESDNNLEVIYNIERSDWFGSLLFSSLGVLEGNLFENEGRNAPDRRETIIDVVVKISKSIYFKK